MAGIRHWILDGYNVMHALNFLSDNLPFEIARERFISWLGQFETLGDKHVTVVFDDNIHAKFEPVSIEEAMETSAAKKNMSDTAEQVFRLIRTFIHKGH